MTNKKPTAIIDHAVIVDLATGDQWIEGFCIFHEARPDLVSRPIHTSKIVEWLHPNTCETMNTVYFIKSFDDTRYQAAKSVTGL